MVTTVLFHMIFIMSGSFVYGRIRDSLNQPHIIAAVFFIFEKTIHMFEPYKNEEIETMLSSQLIGKRIGCNSNNTTYVVPISYAYDGEFIYSLTREGMKINIMRQNPNVCFKVEDIRTSACGKA